MATYRSIAAALVVGTLAVIVACGENTREATDSDSSDDAGTEGGKGTSKGGSSGTSEEESSSSSSGSTSSSSGGSSSSSGSTSGSTSSSSGSTSSSSSGSIPDSGTPDSGKPDSGVVDAGSCTTTAPSNVCGLTPQCGCAANQTCDVTNYSNGAVSCVGAGAGATASVCSSTSQCALGLTCVRGACRPYCAKAGQSCNNGLGECMQLKNGNGSSITNLKVCAIPCAPRNPSAACGANNCIWDEGPDTTDCATAGTKGEFETCSSSTQCLPGFACVDNPDKGLVCERWCRVGNSADCPGSPTCVDVFGGTGPNEGNTRLGFCE